MVKKDFKLDHEKPTLNFDTINKQQRIIFPQTHVFIMKIIEKEDQTKLFCLLFYRS